MHPFCCESELKKKWQKATIVLAHFTIFTTVINAMRSNQRWATPLWNPLCESNAFVRTLDHKNSIFETKSCIFMDQKSRIGYFLPNFCDNYRGRLFSLFSSKNAQFLGYSGNNTRHKDVKNRKKGIMYRNMEYYTDPFNQFGQTIPLHPQMMENPHTGYLSEIDILQLDPTPDFLCNPMIENYLCTNIDIGIPAAMECPYPINNGFPPPRSNWRNTYFANMMNMDKISHKIDENYDNLGLWDGGYGRKNAKHRFPSTKDLKKLYFSTFKQYRDNVQWLLDDSSDLDWPGTEKLKRDETYEGIIRYFFTPDNALFLLTNSKVEACLTKDNLPENLSVFSLKQIFKPDHLLQVKLKWPLEYDSKNRPKVVLSLDKYNSHIRYSTRDRVCGTPVFFTKNMAIFKLDEGDHMAQMFIFDLGLPSVFLAHNMSQFFEKGERVELEILRAPSFPKAAGYLARIPRSSPKFNEWTSKFPELSKDFLALGDPKKASFVDNSDEYREINCITMPKKDQKKINPSEAHKDNYLWDILPSDSNPCTIASFTSKIGGSIKDVLRFLFLKTKIPVNSSKPLTRTLAQRVYNFVTGREEFLNIDTSLEDKEIMLLKENDTTDDRLDRPPIVVLMGHIDHGKTSLFDLLCKTDVASREAGNITQGVRASKVSGEFPITLIDTPGHEVFDAMRRCGACIADMALIAISSQEGLMTQTIESLELCERFKTPFVIVITKSDLPSAYSSTEDIATELAKRNIMVEPLGGDVQLLTVSTVNDVENSRQMLVEAILLQAAANSCQAMPEMPEGTTGDGYILESGRNKRFGPYCTLVIKNGRLRRGDYLASSKSFTKIGNMRDNNGEIIEEAGPSDVVYVNGFEECVPKPGDSFIAFKYEHYATILTEHNRVAESESKKECAISDEVETTLRDLNGHDEPLSSKFVPVILKCNVQGSVDALGLALKNIQCKGMKSTAKFSILRGEIGDVVKADIVNAGDNNGIVVAFGSNVSNEAKVEAKRLNVKVIRGDVIYDLIDKAKKELTIRLDEKLLGKLCGKAKILKVFDAAKRAKAAGCVVVSGKITTDSDVRIMRGNIPVYMGKIASLRHTKDSTLEALESESCGMTFVDFNDIQADDIIEAYV